MINIADMAIQMSNFDNFVIDQMSSKFAQTYFFVFYFRYKKISILGSLDIAENCQKTTFWDTQYIHTTYIFQPPLPGLTSVRPGVSYDLHSTPSKDWSST